MVPVPHVRRRGPSPAVRPAVPEGVPRQTQLVPHLTAAPRRVRQPSAQRPAALHPAPAHAPASGPVPAAELRDADSASGRGGHRHHHAQLTETRALLVGQGGQGGQEGRQEEAGHHRRELHLDGVLMILHLACSKAGLAF